MKAVARSSKSRVTIVVASVFAVVGVVAGVGLKWLAQDRSKEVVEVFPMPTSPEIQLLLESEIPEPPSPEREVVSSLDARWDEFELSAPVVVPPEARMLLDGARPMTSEGIRSGIERLALPERLSCWAALIAHARVEEFPELFDRASREAWRAELLFPLYAAVAARWARLDPEGAFEAFRFPRPVAYGRFGEGVQIALREWHASEPDAAFDVVEKLGLGGLRTLLVGTLIEETRYQELALESEPSLRQAVADRAPLLFLETVDLNAVDSDSTEGRQTVRAFWHLADGNVEEARLRLDRMPDGELREIIQRVVVERWAEGTPSEAFNWIDSLPEADEVEVLKQRVLSKWIRRDPVAARGSVEATPCYGRRLERIHELGRSWGQVDPGATRRWIEGDLVGLAQEQGLRGYLGMESRVVNRIER